jgi:hypothetical protein
MNPVLLNVCEVFNKRIEKLPPIKIDKNEQNKLPCIETIFNEINFKKRPIIEEVKNNDKNKKNKIENSNNEAKLNVMRRFSELTNLSQIILHSKIRSIIYHLKLDLRFSGCFYPFTFGNYCILFSELHENINMLKHPFTRAALIIHSFMTFYSLPISSDDVKYLKSYHKGYSKNQVINRKLSQRPVDDEKIQLYNFSIVVNRYKFQNRMLLKYPMMEKYIIEVDRFYFGKNSSATEMVRLIVSFLIISKLYSVGMTILDIDEEYKISVLKECNQIGMDVFF